jgi:hypothetical protein
VGAFDEACGLLARTLTPSFRRAIVADAIKPGDFSGSLLRLRDRMHADIWSAGAETINLSAFVAPYDARTRAEGFHVLHDWDGTADTVTADTIPIDVLNFVARERGADAVDPAALAILVDYYFLHLLQLMSLRIWDEGEADANLDRVDALLRALQGSGGSGQLFVADAGALILLATSHFELVEIGYDNLLARVRRLNPAHRLQVALPHAASMGSHLRFGFQATYARDTVVMRNDNVADYPWLLFAVETTLDEYVRLREAGVHGPARDAIVEKLLNGLSADARALIGEAPVSLMGSGPARMAFRERFARYRGDLLAEFERLRPSERAYSPLSFFFNFSHNLLKGTVVDALLRGRVWRVTFNDLLSGVETGGAPLADREELARTLMAYARANPDRIRGQLMPVIVYDPQVGREFVTIALRKLTEE